jgi:chemotaxis protein methyltransferase CheR
MSYEFGLSEIEFRLLRDLIHDRFGIFFQNEKYSLLRMKLYPRVVQLGLGSFRDYFNFLKFSDREGRELEKMISLITNNETYFFRESSQLLAFRDHVLPELKKQKSETGEKRIRILSAGCSTGEEVYTLAILAFETGNFFWGWDLQILGLDVSESALEFARQGIYYPRAFRMTEADYLRNYFSANGSENYKLKESIRKMTKFIAGNITNIETWKDLGEMDIIFCRNVLIYFSDDKIKQSANNFYQSLRPGGFLLLGHSETLTGIFADFKFRRFPGTVAYQK